MDLILLVDDEVDLVSTYERLLRRQGYQVVAAHSCRAGLVVVERDPLALVITDLRLPDGDGLDIVRAARRTTPSPTPSLVVTAFASEASRAAALAAGASGYLAKPFAAAALVSLVQNTLTPRPGA